MLLVKYVGLYGGTLRLIQTEAASRFRAQSPIVAAEVLGAGVNSLNPTLAAALIGTPVSVALGGLHELPARTTQTAQDEEDED